MKLKKRRYLRPLKLGKNSKDFFVFDVETGVQIKKKTWSEHHKKFLMPGDIEYILSARPEHLIFGVVYGKVKGELYIKVIDNVKDFQKEFKKRIYKNKIVYAHNAEYDLSCIFSNIYELDRSAIFNGKFIAAGNDNCRFADSFNLLPTSVKDLGEKLGIPKGNLGSNLLSSWKNIHEDIKYCVRDCEIVYKSLEKLFQDVEPSYTIGSLVLKIFRNQYLKSSIKINEHSDKFFAATYGGRTEAFRLGECNGMVYDINSAYPKVMRDERFPDPGKLRVISDSYKAECIYYHLILEKDKEGNYKHEGMITCSVYVSPLEKLPVLPFRKDSRLIFPCGNFTGSWTFPEFREALKNHVRVTAIQEIVYAPSIESPFKPFVNFYYNERLKTNDLFLKYFFKLLLNNLFGKLLQKAKEEFYFCKDQKEAITFMKEKKIKKGELLEVQGGFFFKYMNNRVFNHTIACWGSYVTAYVRVMLYRSMVPDMKVGKLLYCDTDSKFTERKMKTSQTELGGWKKEKKIIKNVRALKDYVYVEDNEEKQALKGVKKNAIQLDRYANVFKYNRMIKTRESFRRIDNLPPGTFIDQVKVLTGDYLKREILKNGETKPFVL